MPTVSDVHKVETLTNTHQGHINSDGTTLNLKKLIGSCTVLRVQKVSDGTSETMIQELDRQLTRLCAMVNEMEMHSINWTLMVSSTSDGASTNKLLQDLQQRDEEQFGPTNTNKCGMHLGVKPKIVEYINPLLLVLTTMHNKTSHTKSETGLHTFVHGFCKLLGQVRTPEYGQGISFRDYELKK